MNALRRNDSLPTVDFALCSDSWVLQIAYINLADEKLNQTSKFLWAADCFRRNSLPVI